jgi:hypothetical protein
MKVREKNRYRNGTFSTKLNDSRCVEMQGGRPMP